MQNMSSCEMCKCPHHKIIPALITLIGVLFLLSALNVIGEDVTTMTTIGWSIAVILIGLNKMMSRKCKCCSTK